jgi:NDP-sugar pyrophosphorylase family protein
MKLTYVYEEEPLDTGGAIKNVEHTSHRAKPSWCSTATC